MDPHYQGDYNPNVEESKRMIERKKVILRQRAHPLREEGDKKEKGATVKPELQSNRIKKLQIYLKE